MSRVSEKQKTVKILRLSPYLIRKAEWERQLPV